MKNKLSNYSSLEMQGLFLVSELELFLQKGGNLPTDVIIALDNFRKIELLVYGAINTSMKDIIKAIKEDSGHLNNN